MNREEYNKLYQAWKKDPTPENYKKIIDYVFRKDHKDESKDNKITKKVLLV